MPDSSGHLIIMLPHNGFKVKAYHGHKQYQNLIERYFISAFVSSVKRMLLRRLYQLLHAFRNVSSRFCMPPHHDGDYAAITHKSCGLPFSRVNTITVTGPLFSVNTGISFQILQRHIRADSRHFTFSGSRRPSGLSGRIEAALTLTYSAIDIFKVDIPTK